MTSKFKYILIEEDGDFTGTNDKELAAAFSESNDMNLVVDTESGEVIADGVSIVVEPTSFTPEEHEEYEDRPD